MENQSTILDRTTIRRGMVLSLLTYSIAIFNFDLFALERGIESFAARLAGSIFIVATMILLLLRGAKKDFRFQNYAYLGTSAAGFYALMLFLVFSDQYDSPIRLIVSMFILSGIIMGVTAYAVDSQYEHQKPE